MGNKLFVIRALKSVPTRDPPSEFCKALLRYVSKNFQSLDPFPILQTYKSRRRMPVCLRCSLNRSQPNELLKTKAQIGYKLDIKCSLTSKVAYGQFISKVHTHRAFIGNFWQPTQCFLSNAHVVAMCVETILVSLSHFALY